MLCSGEESERQSSVSLTHSESTVKILSTTCAMHNYICGKSIVRRRRASRDPATLHSLQKVADPRDQPVGKKRASFRDDGTSSAPIRIFIEETYTTDTVRGMSSTSNPRPAQYHPRGEKEED